MPFANPFGFRDPPEEINKVNLPAAELRGIHWINPEAFSWSPVTFPAWRFVEEDVNQPLPLQTQG